MKRTDNLVINHRNRKIKTRSDKIYTMNGIDEKLSTITHRTVQQPKCQYTNTSTGQSAITYHYGYSGELRANTI